MALWLKHVISLFKHCIVMDTNTNHITPAHACRVIMMKTNQANFPKSNSCKSNRNCVEWSTLYKYIKFQYIAIVISLNDTKNKDSCDKIIAPVNARLLYKK